MPKPEARPAETEWGKCLDMILKRKGMTLGDFSRAFDRERTSVYRFRINSKRGSTVKLMSQMIAALDMTWAEWGHAMDEIVGQQIPQKISSRKKKSPDKEVTKLKKKKGFSGSGTHG